MAVGFDLARAEAVGNPQTLADDLRTWDNYGTGQFTLASDGTLAYVSGEDLALASFVWVDRATGRRRPLGLPRDRYGMFSLSPDGRRLAASVSTATVREGMEIRLFDLARGTWSVIDPKGLGEEPPADRYPRFTPDGRRLFFRRGPHLMVTSLGEAGEPEAVWTATPGEGPEWLCPMSFSPDGRVLAAFGPSTAGSPRPVNHLYTMQVAGDDGAPLASVAPELFLGGAHQQFFDVFSPDGRALAYLSDESGRWEIYVTPYPSHARACRVSRDGGTDPSWSPDGREVLYVRGTTVYAVEVLSVAECRVGEPRALLSGPFPRRPGFGHDLTRDGRRLLMLEDAEFLRTTTTVNVWTGLHEELRRRLPRPAR